MADLAESTTSIPWWEMEQARAAAHLVELESEYSKTYAWRRARSRRLAGMYNGRSLNEPFMRDSTFSWRTDPNNVGDVDDDEQIRLIRNKSFEYVETVVGKIGAEDSPQPALMVTDGDWDLKRRVELNSRLLNAEYGLRQGQYASVHALTRQGIRLAYAATGSVAAKVYPWPEEDRVVVELHDTLDMFLDDTELTYGSVRTFGEVTWWPPYRLAANYPGDRAAIEAAIEERKERGGLVFAGPTRRAHLVPVWEAWAVSVAGKPGRHLACLRDGTVLVDESWESDEPPFAFFHCSPPLTGVWSTPPMDIVYEEIVKANEILHTCDVAHTHTPKQVHYVHEASLEDINDVVAVSTLKVVKTKVPGYTPHVENPPPFDRIDLELLHEHEAGIARALGIDEMHSAGSAEPGLPSAVAQREAGARFDNRHAALHRDFIQWVAVDIGRHMLKAQRKLFEDGHAFKRKWTGEMFSKEIEAKDILDLDVEGLEVQVKPISEKKNTPEERVQYAQELVDRGVIPFESFVAVLENYDTPGETRVIKTQRRWVAWQIDSWLMTDPNKPVEYQGPRPWMRKPDAMVQVVDALMEAEISGAPIERLQHFLDFIAELSTMMTAEQAPPQAAQAPLGGLQPAAGAAPGAPPMLTPGPAVAPPAPGMAPPAPGM